MLDIATTSPPVNLSEYIQIDNNIFTIDNVSAKYTVATNGDMIIESIEYNSSYSEFLFFLLIGFLLYFTYISLCKTLFVNKKL